MQVETNKYSPSAKYRCFEKLNIFSKNCIRALHLCQFILATGLVGTNSVKIISQQHLAQRNNRRPRLH